MNLAGQWSAFWAVISTAIGPLAAVIGWVGLGLIIFGVGKYVWEKRRGGGASGSTLLWTLLAGFMLAGPNLFFPIVLGLVDKAWAFFAGFSAKAK